MKSIPFFNYSSVFREHDADYCAALTETSRRGAYIMQQELLDFEAALAEYLGVRHAFGCADGTMALIMGLRAAGLPAGAEVIVPSHTFIATVAAVHHAGGVPVLADTASDHLVDPASIRAMITEKTFAVMPVQLNGRTCDMAAIGAIADEYNLVIVEDACQALGSTFSGRPAGTFGAAGAFSFYPSKTLGCFGDGGAVVTDDEMVAEKIRLYRDHGRGADGKVTVFGYNSRLDNIQAAVLLKKLKRYQEAIDHRRRLAAQYHYHLHSLEQLLLPPPPDADPRHFDIYQNYEIEADNRDGLRRHLEQNGVSTILQWGGFMVHQFESLGLRGNAPAAEKVSARFMLLPMNTSLSEEDVDYVCRQITEFYSKHP